jgi:hypothetical protein
MISLRPQGLRGETFIVDKTGGETSYESEKCRERRRNFSVNLRSSIDHSCFFHFGSFSVDCRIGRGGRNPNGHIRILTLKRIHAEGLQQRRNKKIKK